MLRASSLALIPGLTLAGSSLALSLQDCDTADDFVNWESPHVHPLVLTSTGDLLLAVNTADGRLEVFDATQLPPESLASIPVGVDPVSVRLRGDGEAWVVNHLSDTVSVVDLATERVVATLQTADEPCDVVFAGEPQRAFVSCSQANLVQVFDPGALDAPPIDVPIAGEDPRALATSPDGALVYVAVFESGNGSTILGGGLEANLSYPPNVVNDPQGPWGGQNPPPNDGAGFDPPLKPGNPPPPRVGLIVRKDDQGSWFDDNGGDWTELVSGPEADKSGRPVGWDLPDHDVAVIEADTLGVGYVDRLMNICMSMGVSPADGPLAVVGTEATNEVRFEPNLNGVFVRVHMALVDPTGAQPAQLVDLNPHLDYTTSNVPPATREQSIGDPRAVAWRADGSAAYVAGMGSNNLVVVGPAGQRAGLAPTIEVGEGPTGLALDEGAGRLYVLNKFAASITVVDLGTETAVAATPFFDPSPPAIRVGRRHLYGTHETSGLGHVSCASCHVDARLDRLSWDLGDPGGEVEDFEGNCLLGGCEDWHPMKGPMLTQTLQDIIGREPHHWRADQAGIEEFNPAFVGLLGGDQPLSASEMQEFEDFLATIHFPPNPFRNLDNSLPTDLPLPGHYTPGRFGPEGLPMPNGDAVKGLALYRPPNLLDGLACVTCHTLPTGMGTDYELVGNKFEQIPPGPKGERHHALVSLDGSTNVTMKIPQLRNLYDRVGFEATQVENTAGFGYLHDGSVDSIARFIAEPVFTVASVQEVADLVALMLAFSGSDLPDGSPFNLLEPPGTISLDSHAAVGVQTTLVDEATAPPAQLALIDQLLSFADASEVGVVVHGPIAGQPRGATYAGGGIFQTDEQLVTLTKAQLLALAQPGAELTFTVVPFDARWRVGIDRDRDGFLNRDEEDAGSDPADCGDVPGAPTEIGRVACAPAPLNSTGASGELRAYGSRTASDQDLSFVASQLPAGEPLVLLVSQGLGGATAPGGGGAGPCLAAPFVSLQAAGTDVGPDGTAEVVVDPLDLPRFGAVQPGERWVFQALYRDGGETLVTDAVSIRFK